MKTLRLLLVSGASLVGQSVLAALAHRRADIEVVATGSVARELALLDVDAIHVTPETARAPEAFARCLLEIIARERPALAIHCCDDDAIGRPRGYEGGDALTAAGFSTVPAPAGR